MKLTFLGTRGFIEARNRRHRMHSSLLVCHGRARVVVDCGEDWAGRLAGLAPDAILVTHVHPDHAWGLRDGAPCSVYASRHASIRTQLGWCSAEGVKKAVFTHCGSQIVAGDERACRTRIRTMGRERGLSARLAYDGQQIAFQSKHRP